MAENSPFRRILGGTWKFFRAVWAWKLKFIKSKFQECKRCKAQRYLDNKMKRLGLEIYSLYRQEETDFFKSPTVKQQLKLVEEAESRLVAIYDRLDEIDSQYRMKRQEIAGGGKQDQE